MGVFLLTHRRSAVGIRMPLGIGIGQNSPLFHSVSVTTFRIPLAMEDCNSFKLETCSLTGSLSLP